MPVMERIQRSTKARQGEGERSDRSRKSKKQQEQQPEVGNQAKLRMLASNRRREDKPKAQEPDNPDAKADQVVGSFESDPMDQSGRTRADLKGMEPKERGEVMGRVQDKVTETQFGRIGKIAEEPGPRSPETPPKEIKPGAPPEEVAPPGGAPVEEAQAPEAGAGAEEKKIPAEGRKEGKPEGPESKAKESEPGPPAEALQKDKKPQEKKGEEKKPAGEPGAKEKPSAAAKAKTADPTKGEKPAGQKASEESEKNKAKGDEEAGKAAKASQSKDDQKAQATSARGSQPGQDQASQALSQLPAESKGPGSGPPAAPGAPARQAAAQGGAAVVATGAESASGGGGGGGGGGDAASEAAVEEAAPEGSPQQAEADKADEKMAGAETAAQPEEEKETEPPETDPKTESEDDLKKKPTSEDQEAIKQAERERQEQTRNPEGAAAGPQEEEQEPSPADHVEVNPAEAQAGLSSLAEGAGGGGEPAGGGGGGGGAVTEQPEPEPPQVDALPPVAAVSAIGGLKVGQISSSIAGVQSAVSEKMTGERADLAANAPSMERPSGSPQTREARIGSQNGAGGAKGKVEETPQGEAVPVEAPQPLPDPGPSPADQVATPPIQGGGEGGTLTQADAENVEAAVGDVPTSDPALDQTAGPPPTVQLEGEANPQNAADQRAKLDQSIVDQQQQGAQDAAQPMGENEIYPVVPKETLTAKVPQGGGAAGGSAAPAVDDETTAVVAEEKQGDEVRASTQQASSDMQAGEEEQAAGAEQEKADHETKVQELEAENAGQQTDARSSAGTQVQQLRGKWSQGQQQAVDTAHDGADAAQDTMSTEVEAQRQKGNDNAAAEIEKGNADAAKVKEQAQSDAEKKKAEAKEESSGGILGWIASKAKAFFEGLKKAVHAVFDLARKALKTLIDGVKKLASAVIDLARNAIIGAIRLAGKALIAIGDVALAAFPELRDKFRGYIEDKVKAAEDTVNKLADALKAGINKLLDLLGAALDGLLNLLEKAYMAAINIVAAAVQTAIKVAQAAIALLGLLAAIIKDVAAHPGQWISNLGAAIIDGIKNHLWKAFKEAVKNWFLGKLEEVLGVGMAIYNILFKGGIKLADVAKMAFEGLKAAIPAALIGILVEKLVAMIVPAAGAVMAIIEGLQAAWGTISRILQAIEKFVSFLKAVKTGTAGPKFAEVLAGAAIIVIDFVANWLVKKIRGPASKIGSKIKAIAKKILEKLKAVAKKVWAKVKKVFKKIVGKVKAAYKKVKEKIFGKKKDKKGKAKQKDDEKKKKKKEKNVEEAMAKTKAAIDSMLSKGTRPLIMRARLAILKIQYGWQQLSLKHGGEGFEIVGVINPTFQISPNIVFEEVNATPFSIKHKDVVVDTTLDRPPSASDSRPVQGAGSSKYESAVVSQGVAPAGQAGPLISPITGPGPVENLSRGPAGRVDPANPNLNPATNPDATLFLGQRQLNDSDLYKRRPDTLVQQNVGGQLVSSISIEATLDAELKQGHKRTQMAESILAAQSVLSRFPNVATPLQLYYIIVAPVPIPSDVRTKIITDLESISKHVSANVTVKWIVVPIA